LGAVLRHVLPRLDPDRRLDVYRLWTFWEQEVGAAIAARAEPASYRDGLLSVRVTNASWMQELQFLKSTIIERLNRRLGEDRIRDIYFVTGSAAVPRSPAAKQPAAGTERRPEKPADELPPLRDERLREVLERIVRAHNRRYGGSSGR